MSLININSVHCMALQLLAKLSPPSGVELLSYKRNRMIAVTVREDRKFHVIEQGYTEDEVTVALRDLSRLFKAMINREFPRSRKVRLLRYAHLDELKRLRKKI
ncbi:MAG: hypothetical protein OEM01_09695 [Desulfobulbaceae bacterium]|nr:hypothetical protein [Desulfobulbaceae bacterium]